ncbi:MAG: zinc ribbon domain-containing protein [Myxococcota bacterium]|nr:zinc ribbon domain-containing protein [Myxococcota bacterium]
MPIYEYHCDSCGETVEVLLRHSDPIPTSCQELVDSERASSCDGNGQLDKVLSVGGYQVRGGGSGGEAIPAPELCGTCGDIPGSCAS